MSALRTEHLCEHVTLHLGDCREILPGLGKVDAVVSDPPYGMDWNTDSKRFTGGQRQVARGEGRDDWGNIEEDDEPFDPAPWLAFPECILWGANHFAARLPVGTTLVWIKKAPHLFGTFLSDAELGWMKTGYGVYIHYEQFPPPARMAETPDGKTAHPTQKPIGLMEWCLRRIKGRMILDPFMGSGTTGVAAIRQGKSFVGIEKKARFFDIACRRIADELKRPRLDLAPAPTPKQEALEL